MFPQFLNLGSEIGLTNENVCFKRTVWRYSLSNCFIASIQNITGSRVSQASGQAQTGLTVVNHDNTLAGTGRPDDLLRNISAIIPEGVCSTVSGTAEKTVIADNYELIDKQTILVKMGNANTSSSITFNINSTGAKSIYDLKGHQITGSIFKNSANEKVLLRYNESEDYYELLLASFWMAKMAMPSSTYASLSIGTSGSTYVSVASGYIAFSRQQGQCSLLNSTKNLSSIGSYIASVNEGVCFIPVDIGDSVTYRYAGGTGGMSMYLIYAEGSKP